MKNPLILLSCLEQNMNCIHLILALGARISLPMELDSEKILGKRELSNIEYKQHTSLCGVSNIYS